MRKFLAVTILAIVAVIAPAYGGTLCDSNHILDCTLNFTQGNSSSGFGTGDFGSVELKLNNTTHVVTITVTLASGWQLINGGGDVGGFPGTFGFSDSVGDGGLSIGSFSSSLYSGEKSDALSDQHFDGFGDFRDAAVTSGPSSGNGLSSLSFTVSEGSSPLTDVNELLNLASPVGGDGQAYFVADVYNGNTSGGGHGLTGLIAVVGPTSVPDGGMTLMLLGGALVSLETLRRKLRA